jgi:phenylacetic acid degradation operon negative regulatory protein
MNDLPIREIPTRVLLESMLRTDGTIDAGELYSVANALGMSDQQVRLCIRRAVADGQLVQDGRGRRAILHATEEMRDAFAPDVEFVRFAYDQDDGEVPWDGSWHVVAFAIPESSRPARDAMRAGILRLGGAPIQGGLYVSANVWEPHVAKLAADLHVEQHLSTMTTTDLRVGGLHAPARIAARLWPLDDIADRYRRLREVTAKRRAQLSGRSKLTRTEHLTIALELAVEFTEAMEPDPLLPPDLLPRPWIGAQARNAFAKCWSRLSALAEETMPQLFQTYADAVRVVPSRS